MNYEVLLNFIKTQKDEVKINKQENYERMKSGSYEKTHEYFNNQFYQSGRAAAYKELKAFINYLKKTEQYGSFVNGEEKFIPTDDDLIQGRDYTQSSDDDYNYNELLQNSWRKD
jgi:hypothetical protein